MKTAIIQNGDGETYLKIAAGDHSKHQGLVLGACQPQGTSDEELADYEAECAECRAMLETAEDVDTDDFAQEIREGAILIQIAGE